MFWKLKRNISHIYHRIKHWVSYRDSRNLSWYTNCVIYEWIKKYKEVSSWYPACYTEEEWEAMVDKMLEWYKLLAEDKCEPIQDKPHIPDLFYTEEEWEVIKEARELYINNNLWR